MPKRLQSILVWACASAATVAVGLGILHFLGTALGALWYGNPLSSMVVLFGFLLGGPLAILVAGIKKRRLGMVLGPLALIPVVTVWMEASDWFEMRDKAQQLAQLDMRAFLSPAAPHHLVAMDPGLNTDCDEICRQILLKTDYVVAVPDSSGRWLVYRELSEEKCHETEYMQRNMRFSGICITGEPADVIADGLLIMKLSELGYRDDSMPVRYDLGIGFSGTAYALIERNPSERDRVLGRWVSGSYKIGRFDSGQIAQPFTRSAFYSAALGIPIQDTAASP